jgi:hypothetical protein
VEVTLMSPTSRGRRPDRRAWALPAAHGTFRGIDLSYLRCGNEDDRNSLISASIRRTPLPSTVASTKSWSTKSRSPRPVAPRAGRAEVGVVASSRPVPATRIRSASSRRSIRAGGEA